MRVVVEHAVAVNDVEGAVRARVEVAPADALEVDRRAVYLLEEERLLVVLERLAGEDALRAAEVEHERVVTGVRAHVEHAPPGEVAGHLLAEEVPAQVRAPRASDDEVAAEQERSLEPRVQ